MFEVTLTARQREDLAKIMTKAMFEWRGGMQRLGHAADGVRLACMRVPDGMALQLTPEQVMSIRIAFDHLGQYWAGYEFRVEPDFRETVEQRLSAAGCP